MADIASLTVRLNAEISQWSKGLETAGKQLGEFGEKVDHIVDKGIERFVEFFAVEHLLEWGKEILEQADHLYKFSQQVGDSVEDLSRLQFALTASGVPAESLSTLFRTLNDNLSTAAGDGTSKAAIAFKILGVNTQDADGKVKGASETLSALADRFATFQDGANKTALAVALFGRRGAELIPFLDRGAAGIEELKKKADELGITLTGETAKAAEEFSIKLEELKATLVQGIGNKILSDVLPNLNALADSFTKTEAGASSLSHVAGALEGGLKLIADIGLTVFKTFDDFGTTLGAVGAQIVALFKGNFGEIGDIQKALTEDIEKSDAEFQKRLGLIWGNGGNEILEEFKVTAKKIDAAAQAPNLAAAEAAAKAVEALTKLQQQLAAQAATFGLGEGALLRYRLTVGDLAKDVATAGGKGQALAAAIEKQADAIARLKDLKEIQTGLQGINAEIEKLKGNTADAALDEFQKTNDKLITAIRRSGSADDERQLESLIKLVAATGDYNESLKKTAQLQDGIAGAQQLIDNANAEGRITDQQAAQAKGQLLSAEADQLQKIYDLQAAIVQQTGNPEQIANLQKLGIQISTLRSQSDAAGQSLRKSFEDDLNGPLTDLETHAKSASEALGELLDNFAKQLLQMANKQLIQQLFGSISGATKGGGGGDIFSTIAGLFAGGAATGKDVLAGHAYRINEKTPDSEYFIPHVSGQVVPSTKLGGMHVAQTFILQAPQGTVSRATQLQTAALAARGLATAGRRGN